MTTGEEARRASLESDAGHARIERAVKAAEARTAAEIVVAIHPSSASYPTTGWLAGSALAAMWLLVFLYHPEPFDFTFLPVELAGAFGLGFLLGRTIQPLRRMLVSAATRRREVDRASKAAFVDLGVTRTRGRTGVLVFASMLEREVRVLCDAGVPAGVGGEELRRRIAAAVRRDDVDGFVTALSDFGGALAGALPRGDDDENELADAPEAAA